MRQWGGPPRFDEETGEAYSGAVDIGGENFSAFDAPLFSSGSAPVDRHPHPAGMVQIKSEATAPPDEHPLLRWRREHGMTLAGMAEQAASTAASLSRIEHDLRTPSYRLARRLGAITGLPAEIFFDRSDPTYDDGASPAA